MAVAARRLILLLRALAMTPPLLARSRSGLPLRLMPAWALGLRSPGRLSLGFWPIQGGRRLVAPRLRVMAMPVLGLPAPAFRRNLLALPALRLRRLA